MPTQTGSGSTTTTAATASRAGSSVAGLDEGDFNELMDGLPEVQRNIRTDRIAGDQEVNVPPGAQEAPEGFVLLLNLRYANEVIYLPESDGLGKKHFVGDTSLEFIDGRLITTVERANFVKRICPYVYIEPTEGEWLTFSPDGFKTRIPEALSEHARRWADAQ